MSLANKNETFTPSGLCDPEGAFFGKVSQEVAVDFGINVMAGAGYLQSIPNVTPEQVSEQASRSCKLAGLPLDETVDLFQRCLEARLAGLCQSRVEDTSIVPVSSNYL